MTYDLVGFLLLAFLALVGAAAVSSRRDFSFPRRLFVGAVFLRIVGSTARYEVLQRYYDGIGDASGYYASGWIMAQRVWQLDFTLFSVEQWLGGPRHWWGTSVLRNLSGIVLSIIGPTMRGEFLVFALVSFAGLFMMALAVKRLAGPEVATAFATFVWLWPSLWFWPASVGKESVIIFAIGLVVMAYAGFGERIRWLPYLTGLGIAFSIRPHVALGLAAATGIGTWFGSWRRLSLGRALQTVLLAVVLLVTFRLLTAEFGLIDADLEGFQEYVSYRAQQTLMGGSSLGSVPTGITSLPMAFVNIWLRPLPWDIHNSMALLSALEIWLLWVFVFRHHRDLKLGLSNWRQHRLLQFAVPFLVGYTLMIGLTFGNLGIIARQRSPLFPFVFLLLCSSALFAAARPRPVARREPSSDEPAPMPAAASTASERARGWVRE